MTVVPEHQWAVVPPAVPCLRQTWIHVSSILLSLLCFFMFALVYNAACLPFSSLAGSYWVMQKAMSSPTLYVLVTVASVAAVLPR